MPDGLLSRSPLAGLLPARHGVPGTPGIVVAERALGGIISLAARRGATAALAEALGWPLPTRPRRIAVDPGDVLWVGPERWLLLMPTESRMEERADLSARIGAHGSWTDQGDGRAVLTLRGPRLRDVLAKGVPIDLHPRIFTVDDVAVTLAGHVGVLLWRDAEDGFVLACARSYAGDLVEWLLDSAAEFGLVTA